MSFRIGKIRFSMSFPLVAVMTAVIMFDTTMSVLICFIAAVMHELGHITVLKHYHSVPEEIRLTLFDIAITDTDKYIRSDKAEMAVVAAGVAVNFISAAAGFAVYYFTGYELVRVFSSAHLTLAMFNSLPVSNLDGGQALFIVLSRKLTPRRAEQVLKLLSYIILVPVAAAGVYVLFITGYNFTLLLTALYLIAAGV